MLSLNRVKKKKIRVMLKSLFTKMPIFFLIISVLRYMDHPVGIHMRAVVAEKRLHCTVLHTYYYTHARRRLNGSLEPLSPSLKLYTYVQNIYITTCNNKWAAYSAPVSCPPWQTTTALHCIQTSSHFPRSLVLVRTLSLCNNISKYHRRYTERFTKCITITDL